MLEGSLLKARGVPLRAVLCRVCLVSSVSVLLSSAAWAQGVPPGVTPGGVQPDLERRELPTAPDTSGFPIPPVIERPLGIDEGPRIQVSAFDVKGVVDHPDAGILKSEIQAMVESKRAAQPEGFTIGQLQEVANEITSYYRKAGFILAQAFVPEQTVENNVIVIQVLEGNLGAVKPEGNVLYSGNVLELPFGDLVGKAVQKDDMESGLLYLTDYPGISVFGVFRPGEKVGDTDLVLNVQEEQRFEWALSGDNYGVETTGEWRAIAEGYWNNPTGAGDRLSAYVQYSFDPTNGLYGGVDYRRPVLGVRNSIGIGISRNDYEIGEEAEDLGIEGTTDSGYLDFRRTFIRSRNLNLYGATALTLYSSDTEDDFGLDAEDALTVGSLELSFDHVDTRFKGINQGTLRYSHGFPDFLGSMDEDGDDKSLRINGNQNHVSGEFDAVWGRIARLQSVTRNNAVLIRLEGQYSADSLSSLAQMGIGGPNSVRAYAQSNFLFDKAYFASVEWISNAPGFSDKPAFANRTWGELLQVSAFYDIGGGRLNSPAQGDERFDELDVSGAGGAIQLNLPGKLSARLDVAAQITDREAANDRDPQYWFSTRYEY